jgi:purine-binding chemotaxis protein CheW
MSSTPNGSRTELLTTFYVGGNYYGIEVMRVQEVTRSPTVIPVPLAPKFVCGLINLRGQLATALGLKELFGTRTEVGAEQMSVVCRVEGNLVSLVVDAIGDVIQVNERDFEAAPDTMPIAVRKFVKGIYKLDGSLLSVLNLDQLAKELSPTGDLAENRVA